MELAQQMATLLGSIKGVVAVVLGGSRARGEAHPSSDLDLGIYYHPGHPPSIEALREVAHRLDDRHTSDAVTDLGEWEPWINGGAWLRIEGQKVDWLYRDLTQVAESIEQSRRGNVAVSYQPGHPFGFPSYLYMGEVALCLPLYDPQSEIAALKALTTPYPAALQQAIVEKFLWEAGFALATARSSGERGDVSYVAGCLFRCVSCLVQVLFALNERYLINEKGALAIVERFPVWPPDFTAIVEDILGRPGTSPSELRESLQRMEGMVEAVRCLTGESTSCSTPCRDWDGAPADYQRG
jgi:predicted nucleotidyltransferase